MGITQPGSDAVTAPSTDPAYETVPESGERFDPFCHILDTERRALCLTDISGRRIHNRNLGTNSSAGPDYCPTCNRAVCPTCREVERLTGRTSL